MTYEVFDGNKIDSTTLKFIVKAVESKHGKARRVWVIDRGICFAPPHGAHLSAALRGSTVGTPKPQFNSFEQHLTEKVWQKASSEVEVKHCPNDSDGSGRTLHEFCH